MPAHNPGVDLFMSRVIGKLDMRPALLVLAVLLAACHSGTATQQAAVSTSPLDGLIVATEDTGAHYSRTDWGDGWDKQPGGCDTRQLVLLHQGHGLTQGKKCAPTCPAGPCWTSPYDGVTYSDPTKLQIDHIVPVKEVNRSRVVVDGKPGLGAGRVWDAARKHAFYQDQENLVAVTAKLNEGKGDSDPGKWTPPQQGCWYAQTYIKVKKKYGLTIDAAEKDGLQRLLATCQGT